MKVSVIVPVYNVEQYIEKCIVSLLKQSLKDFEIIIVNDGSTDKSIEKIQKIIDNNENIKLINQENAGLSAARNTGLKNAVGEYISFVDSDDWVEENFLSSLYDSAILNDLDIVCSGYTRKSENDDIEDEFIKRSDKICSLNVISGESALLYQYRNYEYQMEVWDDLYRRSFLIENDLKFEEGLLHEDEIFTPLALIKAKRVQFIKNVDYCYRQRQGSITNSKKTTLHINSLLKASECVTSYIDLTENKMLQKSLASNATMIYARILSIDSQIRLQKYTKNKIKKNIGNDNLVKSFLVLNTPNLAIMLRKMKKTYEKIQK